MRMLGDEELGYAGFLRSGGASVHGTWDDHDYGGNDRGREMTEKEGRRDAYLEFLGVPRDSPRWGREGVYSSVDFGVAADDSGERRDGVVRVIFLDTRWHRDRHCIPSVASNPHLPYGSLVGCVTRWITAGLDLPSILPSRRRASWCPEGGGRLLGGDQWSWLEGQLNGSRASMHVRRIAVLLHREELRLDRGRPGIGDVPGARSRCGRRRCPWQYGSMAAAVAAWRQ